MARGGSVRYHADTVPDPEEWLASSDSERNDAVLRFHRLKGAHTGENPDGHALLHVTIENQIALGDPPETRIAIERLQREGLDRHEALHAAASILAVFIAKAMRGVPFNNEEYRDRMENLRASLWNDGLAYLPKESALLASEFLHTANIDRANAAIAAAPDASAVPALVAIAEFDDLDGGENEEPFSFRAIGLLGKRGTVEAVEALLAMLPAFDEDIEDMRSDRVIFALQASGAAALEPVLRTFDTKPDLRDAMSEVLSKLGIRDERIFTRLCTYLQENPLLAACGLGSYGDEHAVPALSAALDALPLGDPMIAREMGSAIEELGGELTPAQQRKIETAQARTTGRQTRRLRELRRLTGEERLRPVVSADRPGRNEPCHCGSGKKYKKCHGAAA